MGKYLGFQFMSRDWRLLLLFVCMFVCLFVVFFFFFWWFFKNISIPPVYDSDSSCTVWSIVRVQLHVRKRTRMGGCETNIERGNLVSSVWEEIGWIWSLLSEIQVLVDASVECWQSWTESDESRRFKTLLAVLCMKRPVFWWLNGRFGVEFVTLSQLNLYIKSCE